MPQPRTYDVAILGLTPTGLAAARHLGRNGCDVVVIDGPVENTECPLAEWVGRDFFTQAHLPKSLAASCRAKPFKLIRYHSAELDRQVEHKVRSAAGYFIRAGDLTKAMRAAATKAKVKVRREPIRPVVHLEEEGVRLAGITQTRARLLLVAQDLPSRALAELGLPVAHVTKSHMSAAAVDVPVRVTGAWAKLRGILHVVASPHQGRMGMFFIVGPLLHLRAVTRRPSSGDASDALSTMITRLREAAIFPGKLALGRARGAVWHPPAGVALDMETHAAKRCLLAGTAGGFVETITGHTLLPSVRSGILAAQTALAALQSKDPQDTLMSFKVSWRKALADYIRAPNTSLQMLLPLLFANRRIVGKFTNALLYGQDI